MTRHIPHILLELLLLSVALLSAGCADPETTLQLNRAEQVMEEHPDSARALLDGIDSLRLSKAQGALYGVLDAQSRHKLDLPLPSSDSLLTLAVDRYTHHGPDSLLMKALFYRAVRSHTYGDNVDAIIDATRSLQCSEDAEDRYWQGKAAELIADIFLESFNREEEVRWRSRAAESYRRAGRTDNYLYALSDLGGAYLNLHDSVNCRNINDSVRREMARNPEVEGLWGYQAYNELFYSVNYATVATTDSIIMELEEAGLLASQPNLMLGWAEALARKGNHARCRELLDTVAPLLQRQDQREILFRTYYLLAQHTGDPKLMKQYADSLLHYQTGNVATALSQPVLTAQRDFFRTEASLREDEYRHTQHLLLYVIAGSIAALCAMGVVYRGVIRRREALVRQKAAIIVEMTDRLKTEDSHVKEIEENLSRLKEHYSDLQHKLEYSQHATEEEKERQEDLKRLLDMSNVEIRKMAEQVGTSKAHVPFLYKKQWQILNEVCKEIQSNAGTLNRTTIANIRKTLLHVNSREFLGELEQDLNRDMDNVMVRLREQCPDLTEEELRLCTFTFARMPNPTIATVMGLKISALYLRRHRLSNKIKESQSPDKDFFLDMLKANEG